MSVGMRTKGKNREDLWAGLVVLSAFFFLLFIYAPIELYCYNIREFWFDLSELMPIMIVLFLGSILASAAAAAIIHRFLPRVYQVVVLPVACIAFLCTYVQGNFLVGNLPPLDGSIPDWSDYTVEQIQSLVLWVIVSLVIVIVYRKLGTEKFARAAKLVSGCMILMLIVTMVSILITTEGYQQKKNACATTKDLYTFSEDENFIVFIIDSVDAASLSGVMEENPGYKDIFTDFTYYENMLGAYPCTMISVPYILSGEWYENEMPFAEYEEQAFRNSPILNSLEEEGYQLAVYENEMPFEEEVVFRFSNVLSRNSRISSYLDFAKMEIKLVGYRYAPFALKKACLFNTEKFGSLWERLDEYPAYSQENKIFYDRIRESEITTVQDKCFKLIHIDGAHVPFEHDEDVNLIENGTYEQSIKASLTITRAYLDKLKAAGVYDNSVVIIMADHGLGETSENCKGRQNPIFFAKGVNEHHELETSQAPVSYEDLQEAYARLLEGRSSSEIFDYQEGVERARRYLFYEFNFDEHLYEYTLTGHASDGESMVLTGNEYIREE